MVRCCTKGRPQRIWPPQRRVHGETGSGRVAERVERRVQRGRDFVGQRGHCGVSGERHECLGVDRLDDGELAGVPDDHVARQEQADRRLDPQGAVGEPRVAGAEDQLQLISEYTLEDIWGRTNPRAIKSAADVMEILRTAMG